MFTVATPTLDANGLFFPILSSPFFISSFPFLSVLPSSLPSTSTLGYSLGFYIKPSSEIILSNEDPLLDFSIYCESPRCNLYLAVCTGFLGSVNSFDLEKGTLTVENETKDQSHIELYPQKTVDGLAVPVWIANLENPIRNVGEASLTVMQPDATGNSDGGSTLYDENVQLELQLRDGENVVWRVRSNANVMEVQDNIGHLNLLHNSTANGSHVVWSTPAISDTLVVGSEGLAVGKELVSNGSSYVARMEKGGLVFYMNKTRFNREQQPPPYWVFPAALASQHVGAAPGLNQVILSAPCSNSPAHLDPSTYGLLLNPGMCSPNLSAINSSSPVQFFSLFSQTSDGFAFWRLEGDGMFYSYSVSSGSSGSAASVAKYSPDFYILASNSRQLINIMSTKPLVLTWQQCSLPMACGPLGLCTPGAQYCSCPPNSNFEAVNNTDPLQGCRRSIDLPNCTSNGTGHTSPIHFVELNSTSSILLFNEWTFHSTLGKEVDTCKQSCSLDCSCNGFFYQKNTSSCFFMSDEISLMQVADTNYTPIVRFAAGDFNPKQQILAKDYVTFLKVANQPQGKSSRGAALIAVAAIIPSVVVLICLLLGMVAYFQIKARLGKAHEHYTRRMLSAEESKELQDILPLLPNRFSYKELSEATESFSRLLGAGGCGSVYAGVLLDGRKVAVKELQAAHLQGIRHSKQFLAEIATIGRINHHNIVRLIGFCWEVSQRLLVYEYVERGSLDRWIFVKDPGALAIDDVCAASPLLLDWKTRYSVALGIARGLNYLHEECEQPILHFDIKPQNILLDNEFVAKLADFGMARLMERDMSAVVTGLRGTPGYIAPEWCSQGTVSKRSDIYSMGMVFLEIVGGRKNLDFSLLNSSLEPEEQEAWHFPSWAARKCEQGRAMELVDWRLLQKNAGEFDAAQALRLIHIAFWCIQESPAMRPYAPTVVQWLEGSSYVEQPPFSTTMSIGSGPSQQLIKEHISFISQSTSCLVG